MSTQMLEQTIGNLVTERPGRARVFETFGIDYCCGGKQPLKQACEALGLDPQTVLGVLKLLEETTTSSDQDWSRATMSELCDNIEQTHHAYLKRELPRMERMVRKVADVHGGRHPYLIDLRDTFLKMRPELEEHTVKEESVFFPICRELEGAQELPPSLAHSLESPIQELVEEHEDAGEALATMRRLTDGYRLPPDACNTYRAMYDALSELERDMHRHVHKENSILFPRAAEVEQNLRQKQA